MFKKLFQGFSLALAAMIALGGISSTQAQIPSVKVPQCLLQKDDVRIYVPCTGVVPIDSSSGNALSWGALFGQSGSAGVINRVITKTAVAAYTSTVVCPANANVTQTELQVSGAGVGLGMNGQTLTGAALGVGGGDADIVLTTVNQRHTFATPPTNAVTAYSPTAFIASCIQTLKR